MSLYEFIQARPFGLSCNQIQLQRTAMYRSYSPLTMKEMPIIIPDSNKVFASRWISNNEIAFGTKCNQLKIVNVTSLDQFSIPLLRRRKDANSRLPAHSNNFSNCGIHSIAVNPSETKMATGGENPNDIGVYRLPQIDPLMLGENGHGDWMFCCTWLDDDFLVSGSRDDYVCLWDVGSGEHSMDNFTVNDCAATAVSDSFEVPFHKSMQPTAKRLCQTSDRIRAMAFNTLRDELAVTSLNGYIHTWDVRLMKQLRSEKLIECQETVTLSYSKEHNLYCCGSYHYLMIFDPRTMRLAQCCDLKDKETGIRSLVSVDNVLTMGTGNGLIRFYDMAANRFITCSCGVDWTLEAGNGRLSESSTSSIQDLLNIPQSEYKHAIYTLSYDRSSTRLFAAGGPLHAQISGNYAAMWI